MDSILIDEARTPLIISGPGAKSTDLYQMTDQLVKNMHFVKVKELDSKEEHDDVDGDYIVDEKARTATLTPAGVKKAEAFFQIDNLMDMENATYLHHVNQAIKAYGTMRRDIDYVVKDGQVLIVDEFTGRIMMGRRYNEGLHQAIEAKEGVEHSKRVPDAGHHYFPELFPHVRQAGRYDRYGYDGRRRVPGDLQAGCDRDSHQQAGAAGRPSRRGL